MTPEDPRHGTVAGSVAGCKCTDCRAAKSNYEKRRIHDANHGRRRLVDATGTQRRIQALAAIGWPIVTLSAEMGFPCREYCQQILYRSRVLPATRDKVAELYERLCMTPGPSAHARNRALKKGWAVPLAYDNIDDPDEVPHTVTGRFDVVAEVETLVGSDTPVSLAARLGYANPDSLARALRRKGRDDLANRFEYAA